jgi:RHS repeat-associated protein
MFGLSRGFNNFGELASELTEIAGQNIYAYALTRDQSGSIASKMETIGAVSSQYAYSYDTAGRLTSVTLNGQVIEEYQYGANGTRTYEQNAMRGIVRTLSYSDEDYLLTAGNTSYQYDVDGFLRTRTSGSQVTAYTYSTRGELLSVNLPDGGLIEYVYDPLGRRIAKKVNGNVVEKYLWKGMTILLAVYDGNDNLLVRFMYADARAPLAMTKDGLNYYLCYDQVGSLRLVTDTFGNVVKEIDYDSFGNVLADSDPTFTVPFGFAGGLYDVDTGLVHFGARDYDPDTGMWTAKDPIGFEGGDTDLYGYCLADPVNGADPFGLAWSDILPSVLQAISLGAQGGWYSINQAAAAIGDLAVNGPPLAQGALALAGLTTVGPAVAACSIASAPAATTAVVSETVMQTAALVDLIGSGEAGAATAIVLEMASTPEGQAQLLEISALANSLIPYATSAEAVAIFQSVGRLTSHW